MNAPFVSQLRTRGDTIMMVESGANAITVRVQLPEAWDVVLVAVSPTEPVLALKVRALAALSPDNEYHDEFVMKLRGFEVLDENASISAVGGVDGSIFLLTHRRRRPVR